jgi:UPF0755 protein
MRYLLFVLAIVTSIFTLLVAPSGLLRNLEHNEDVVIIIEKGTSSKDIAFSLKEKKVISHPYGALVGIALLKVLGKTLKHGEYLLSPHDTLWNSLKKIADGEVIKHLITIAEGLTVHEVVQKLNSVSILSGEITELPKEGFLLPQTYDYYYGDSRQGLIKRMVNAMENIKKQLWNHHNNNSYLETWDEVLTLASIVEKETALAEERPIVASVYLNRLQKGMPLQSDPTVIYAVTNGETSFVRQISKADLKFDSAYNTYINNDLPPTPIACPGEASIKAVLNPSNTNYLYFVADGYGGHNFNTNLKDHNSSVSRWKALKKQRT